MEAERRGCPQTIRSAMKIITESIDGALSMVLGIGLRAIRALPFSLNNGGRYFRTPYL